MIELIDPYFSKYTKTQKQFLYVISTYWLIILIAAYYIYSISLIDVLILGCIGVIFIFLVKLSYQIMMLEKPKKK